MRTSACIRQYNMHTIDFNDYLLMCICSSFMHVNKQNIEKYMYEISSGVPTKRRQSRQSRKYC